MPDPHHPRDRTAAERQADHEGLARLSETLVPALVAKLNASALGELEVHEGDWRIRLRRPAISAAGGRRAERPRLSVHAAGGAAGPAHGTHATGAAASHAASEETVPERRREPALAPAVGLFRSVAAVGTRVRAGDRVAIVDLLGIPQDVVSPIDGTVVEVLAQGGGAVEYGEEVALVEAGPEPRPAGDGVAAADGLAAAGEA